MLGKVFGGVIAFVLLGIYVYLVFLAGSVVVCTTQPACLEAFNPRMASAGRLVTLDPLTTYSARWFRAPRRRRRSLCRELP